MNVDDTVGSASGDRLSFVKHKGQTIFVVDCSHCSADEMMALAEQVRMVVARHTRGSVLLLADFNHAEVDKKVARRLKEVLTLDRPFVKRSAWVHAESVPHVFYENIKSFSQREIPTFKTREEAMDWLVQDSEHTH
jgi:SpoIIAA-like